MSKLFWLKEEHMEIIRPQLPKSRGIPRVCDLRVLSGIIHIQIGGLRWTDAAAEYGPAKTLYARWRCWSGNGVILDIFRALVEAGAAPKMLLIDATHVKVHRTAASLTLKEDTP